MMPSTFAPVASYADAQAFFSAVFPSTGYVSFRTLFEGGRKGIPSNHIYDLGADFPSTLEKFLAWCELEDRSAFVIPGLVRPHQGGCKDEDVIAMPAIVADFDTGDALAKLAAAEEVLGPATVVVESGGSTELGPKVHSWWRLDSPTTDIKRVCEIQAEIAARVGGDKHFGHPAQVIRVPASWHRKGDPKLVRLRTVRPEAAVRLSEICSKLRTNDKPPTPTTNVIRPAVWDLNAVRFDDESNTDRVLTKPILAEAKSGDVTRFEGASVAFGHYIRQIREGRFTEAEARAAAHAWNTATLIPPWPSERVDTDFSRLLAIDLKAYGPFIPPAPIISTTPGGLVVLDRPADRFAGAAPERQWLVEGLIPLATPGVFAAVGDAGKSMLALRLALFTSCYGPSEGKKDISDPMFFGCPVRGRGAVVMLTGEDDDAELHRRLNSLDPTHIRKGKPLYIMSMISEGGARAILMDGPAGPQPTPFWDDLRAQLEAVPDLKLVVFDPLSTFTGADLNDNAVGAALMTMLASLASKTGAAVMVVHHLNKGSSPTSLTDARNAIRGAGALVDNSRWSLVMWETDQDDAFTALDALGRKEESIRAGVVYKGGIAKSNAPGKKLLRTLIRGPEGLLEDMTDTIASNTPRNAEVDVMVHRALVDYWQVEKRSNWSMSSLKRTKVSTETWPAIKQRTDIKLDTLVDSLERLLLAGKIRQNEGGKFEPVVD